MSDMGERRRWARRKPKPLGHVIDVYKCLSCGDTLVVNADGQTFKSAPPLECKRCPGQPDMQAGRYYSTVTTSSAGESVGHRRPA